MAVQPFWYEAPEAWDTCTLGGNVLPGLCRITSPKKGHKLHIKESPGTHGATITDQGYKPAQFTIVQMIWSREHWVAQQAIMPALEPIATKAVATPFDILHPVTAMRNIKSVIIESIEGPEESGSVKGAREIKYTCVEFFKSPKNFSATHTAKSSIQPRANALTQPTVPADPSAQPIPTG